MQKENPIIKNYILSPSVYVLEENTVKKSTKNDEYADVKFCNKNSFCVHLCKR